MAVSLTNSGAGLFDRLGKIGGGVLDLLAIMGGANTSRVSGASWVTRLNTLDTNYALSVAQQRVLDGLYNSLSGWQQGQSGFFQALKTLATNTVIEMVNTDTPLPQKTLAYAMTELIRQMKASGDDVNASTISVGSQTAVGSPTGTPNIVVTSKGPDGNTREYLVPETIKFTCAGDQFTGSTLNREPFLVTSPQQISDAFAYNWPGGSGISKTLTAVDPTLDSSTTLLYNGDFETFSSNTPSHWTVLAGAAGTDILAGAGYMGNNALEFAYATGAELSSIAQTLNDSGGSTSTLKPNTVYLLSFWAKKESGLSGNGTLSFDLIDGSNTMLTDDAGNNCQVTQTAAGLTTSYAKYSGAIVTPKVLPSVYKFRVRLSTAIADSGKSVYIDNLQFVEGNELYTGGPYAAVFPGATALVKGDAWTVAISNTWGVAQKMFQQWFDMRGLGLQLPSDSAAGETLGDSLFA